MKKIYTRTTLNGMLYELLGRAELVDQWWNSNNKAFDGKTPNEIYWANEQGRQEVANYILSQCDYNI
jgi:hypothetical protein